MTNKAIGLLVLITAVITAGDGMANEPKGNPAAGEAQALVCAGCHGQDGWNGIDGTYPPLAGQNEKYLYKHLVMIQSGERELLLMTGILDGKSEQDLADLAAYYASLPAQTDRAEGDDEQIARAEKIYRGGIADKGVASCAACHGPRGVGNPFAGFPRVAGMPKEYTISTLTDYREGKRATDEGFGGMMRGVAEGLTDGEIEIIADYLQGLN